MDIQRAIQTSNHAGDSEAMSLYLYLASNGKGLPMKQMPMPENRRSLMFLRWSASALIWPTDHIDVAEFRKRLEFFALNATSEDIRRLADKVQL